MKRVVGITQLRDITLIYYNAMSRKDSTSKISGNVTKKIVMDVA